MQYQVPQYLDVEDKIIGPLTLKQFIYLLICGGILFLLFNILAIPAFIIIAIPISMFTLLLVFYKVGNQRFTKFVANFLGFIGKPSIYTWKKIPPKKPAEEPAPKIIKKTEAPKEAPKGSGLEETQWKVEIQKKQ